MKKLIPKIIDIVCFVSGSMLLIYNLLDFRSGDTFYSDIRNYDFYYYSDSTQILAGIGLSLIVLGFLIRSWRKEKK